MANLARSPSTHAVLRAVAPRRLVLLLASAALISAALLSAAAPAGAVVKTIEGAQFGVQPRNNAAPPDGSLPTAASFANAGGNPVLHANSTYAIYWDPTDHYHGDWQHVIDQFLQGLGVESGSLDTVFSVDTQYTDKSNTPASYASTFMGAYTDTNPYPSAFPAAGGCKDPKPLLVGDAITCITDKQIREELQNFVISQHGLHKGMGSIFYVLTPPGVTVCAEAGASPTACSSDATEPASFCSYHSDINPTSPTGDENTILYAVIPWVAGGLGDYHLQGADQAIPGYECQDGGYDPSNKEKPEAAKEKNKAEKEAYTLMDAEEKTKVQEQEAREGPHQEEPNQPNGNGPDGSPDTGLADLITNQIAVEQQNTVTDPLLNAWQDPEKNEATDECRNFFATSQVGGSVTSGELSDAGTLFNQTLNGGSYYLNDAFNMAALRLPYPGVPCLAGVNLAPQFTAPNPVKSNEVVGFDGMESNISLVATSSFPASGPPTTTYATYTWSFGDGSPNVSGYAPGAPVCSAPWLSPCAGSAYHSYEYGGNYTVTLTVRDVGGNTASATQAVTVLGPARPGTGAPGASGGSGSGSSGSSSGSSTPGTTSTGAAAGSLPAPVTTSSVLSRSLASVLKSGLVVRYSVNEQVAGRFEVLLAASIARRLGVHGPAATGLPKGMAPQIVIAKAILVTTRGGRNTVKILLPKSTATRLHRLHKVSLMVRLVVRNASPKSPVSTTSVSTVTLTG